MTKITTNKPYVLSEAERVILLRSLKYWSTPNVRDGRSNHTIAQMIASEHAYDCYTTCWQAAYDFAIEELGKVTS